MADVAPGGSPDQAAQPAQPQPAQDPAASSPTPPASADPPAGPPAPEWDPHDRPTTAFLSYESADQSVPLGGYPASGFPAADPSPADAGPVDRGPVDRGPVDSGVAGDGWGSVVPKTDLAMADAVPPVPGRRSGWRRWLPLTLLIIFIASCAIAMLAILGFKYGATAVVVGLVAAILPVPLLVGCFLWLDRYEPEPTRYLLFCFAWGSSVATLTSLGVNSGGAALFDLIGLPDSLVAVLVAPFIEELMKAAGPILLLWWRRREWSGITDGIVYCGLSAIGFAMVENVLYLGGHGYAPGADQFGPATGIQNVVGIFILRIFFTGFAHPLFTSMSGIGLGIASRTADRRLKWLAPIGGLTLAMMLHGTFNLLPTLSVATGQALIMLYGYVGFMVPLFFTMVGLAIALRGWEGRLAERILPEYVKAGWLSPPEVAALGTLGRRHSARRWARRVAGESGIQAMRSFQFAATRLALIRDGMQRGLDRKPEDLRQTVAEEQRLLEAIVSCRAAFQGRDPQTPQAFWDGANYQITFPDGSTRSVAPPDDPVVPVPVCLPPQPVAVAPGWPGYAPIQQFGYAAAQPAGYAAQPQYGYGAQPQYPQPQPQYGYAAQPQYPQPQYGYAAQPQYPQPQYGYAAQPAPSPAAQFAPGYAAQPTYGYAAQPPSGYGAQSAAGYTTRPSHGNAVPPSHGNAVPQGPGYAVPQGPGYGGQPPPSLRPSGYGHTPQNQPGPYQQPYGARPAYPTQPGYPVDQPYGVQPGYPPYQPHGAQPSHPADQPFGTQPGYQPYGTQPPAETATSGQDPAVPPAADQRGPDADPGRG